MLAEGGKKMRMNLPLHEVEIPKRAVSPLRRIEVDPETDCWNWTGHAVKGYARVSWNRQHILVHRWIFARYVRPLKDGEEVHHKCRNSLCINPAHLEALYDAYHTWVTLRDNGRLGRCSKLVKECIYEPMERVTIQCFTGVVVCVFPTYVTLRLDDDEEIDIEVPWCPKKKRTRKKKRFSSTTPGAGQSRPTVARASTSKLPRTRAAAHTALPAPIR
jgi:hypothetical protein